MPNQPLRSSPVSVVGNHYFVNPYGRDAQIFAWGKNSPVSRDETKFKQEIQNRPMSDAVTKVVEELGSVAQELGMTGITWYEVPTKNLVTIGYRGKSESISFDLASSSPEVVKGAVKNAIFRLWESEFTREDVAELARRKRLDPMKISLGSTLNFKRLINYGKMSHLFIGVQALLDFFDDIQEQEIINEMLAIIGELKYAIRQFITLEYKNENGKLRAIPKLIYRKAGMLPVIIDVRIAMMPVPEAMTEALQFLFRQGYMSGDYPELAQYDSFSDLMIGGDMVKPAEVGGGGPVSSPMTIPSAGSYATSVAPAQADGSSITAAEFLSLPESIQQKLIGSLPNQERIRLTNEVQKLRQSESTDTSKIGKMGRKLGL